MKNSLIPLRVFASLREFFGHEFMKLVCSILSVLLLTSLAPAQAAKPQRVTEVNEVALKKLLKPNGKPLLVNFWATWCDPCREEFPELVKINNETKGKIDFLTVSLDDLADIDGDVPKFLTEMKADMPAVLLKTDDENATIAAIAKDWSGGLPFTILYNEKGEIAYFRQGKVVPATLRSEIAKLTH
jgi:thiol-disulfide isomerase/thioredoxin